MKKILVDINVFLDIFLKRKPFYNASSKIFYYVEKARIKGYICSLSFPTLFYIIQKELNRSKAISTLEKIRAVFDIASVDQKVIDLSLVSNFKDFEDAVQYYCALENGLDNLITRNKKDFLKNDLPILTPEEFITINNISSDL